MNTIINIVANMVIISMVAKPLTDDSPNINNTIATIKVVTLASNIELQDCLFPSLNATFKLLPSSSDSLIRSLVITHESTAIPIPKTNAAIPGSVKTPPINQKTPITNNMYKSKFIPDINPANL